MVDSCREPLHKRSPWLKGRPDMTRNSARLSLLIVATLFVASTFPTPALAQTVSFIARRDFVVGKNPVSVAVGDFNGDRVQDLAVANYDSTTVQVLLGNGDGTFRAVLTFGVGSRPRSVAVGDFNGDGVPDLAVTNYESATVSVLLGNGDGTFRAALTFGAGINPFSVAEGGCAWGRERVQVSVDAGSLNDQVLRGHGGWTFRAA